MNDSDTPNTGICWRNGWFAAYESLWSLLRKFAFLNAASLKEIRENLCQANAKVWSSAQWKCARRSDLRTFGGIDPLLLSRILNVDHDRLRQGTLIPFLREGEHEILTSHYLRFCPSCIKLNFHASIYQTWLLRKCPIHDEPLTLRCDYCQTKDLPYTIESVPFAPQLGCRNCTGHENLVGHPNANADGTFSRGIDRLKDAAEILLRRAEMKVINYPITAWIHDRASTPWKSRRLSQFSNYWTDITQEGQAKTLSSPSIKEHACIQHEDRERTATKGNLASRMHSEHCGRPVVDDLHRELFSTYKSICRQLRHSLRPHLDCIETVASLARSHSGVFLNSGTICAYANMFLLWRMYWENVDQPYKLLSSYRRRNRMFAPELRLPLTPPEFKIPRQFMVRIFVGECLGVLDECRLLTTGLHRKGFYSFNLGHLKWTRQPYWIIENPSHNIFSLHTWKPRAPGALGLLFKSPEMMADTALKKCDLSGIDLVREVTTGRGKPIRTGHRRPHRGGIPNRTASLTKSPPKGNCEHVPSQLRDAIVGGANNAAV